MVLGLVTAQVIAAAATGARSATTVVVPVVDVAILGLLLRFVASRRLLSPANYLTVTAAVATVGYDLSSAVQGDRLALPGTSAQVLGVVCVLLFGAAAQHPSMATAFAPTTLTRRRAPSAALLGLLPLVAVPLALWWVSATSAVPGLPTPVLLAAASAVAGLCLVRAAAALRTSEHLADHDPLTGLVNRRGLAGAYAAGTPEGGWALLLVDVDDFKQVNDTHGHAVGDELLRRLRDRLLAATAPTDVVARLGGDEFVVLTTADRARPVADAVLRSLREPVPLDVLEVRTSASIGLAGPDPDADLDEIVTRADIAMYATKAGGRDGLTTFEPRMRADVAHRYGLTGDLRRLLGTQTAGREGHLDVHYQPLVDLATGRPVGAEALVRWQHPRHGLLGPARFLDLVSAAGMDADLDAAILTGVVQQLARWRDQGLTLLPVSVNLTCASLLDPHLDQRVLGLLAAHAVPAHLLHVEITEHEELPTDGPAEHTLRRLADAGVAVHLDDYGIGYTSLSYLKRFPVTVLKLDRSVVEAITTGDQTQLVTGIRAMADTLGLDLLAEGVETLEQYDRLRDIGVCYGQGYLFSKPLPADDYATRVLDTTHVPRAGGQPPRPRVPSDDLLGPGPTADPAASDRWLAPVDEG